jgi:hypothetical protein
MDQNSDADGPSKQAVAKRINKKCQRVFSWLLQQAFEQKLASSSLDCSCAEFLNSYQRVLVQDSTIIQLPSWLYEEFSGVSNGSSKVCNCRIQVTYDILNKLFINFSIDPYSKNDLAAAPELELQPGDLVLRDRGYLTQSEMQRHQDNQADFIYRHKANSVYLDPLTEEPIDLLKLLSKNASIDQTVLINNEERTPVRIVATAVDAETANIRRMKAKKESHSKNPSRTTLALMSWTIFITSVRSQKAGVKTLLTAYGLRWRIEIIFKAWKSHAQFTQLHRVNKTQLMIILTARLLRIVAFTNILYRISYDIILRVYGCHLSLLKFLNELQKHPERAAVLFECLLAPGIDESARIWHSLKRYCCYDKRTRLNYHEMFEAIA